MLDVEWNIFLTMETQQNYGFIICFLLLFYDRAGINVVTLICSYKVFDWVPNIKYEWDPMMWI